ncbi:MAG: hypothetical protein EXR86_04250 [Gammaproteobacteria bacterium]|nr:hypothetical protein [Gammaproteobacteria bacterium]
MYWTYQFDRPATRPGFARGALPYTGAVGSIDLVELAPGLGFATTVERLAALKLTGGSPQGRFEVYEYRVLRDIEQRQRLALVHSADQIDTSALVIDFDSTGGVDSVAQTFERVRKALIDRYGAPTFVLEEGEFTPNFVVDINAQRLLRVMEWETPVGVLRFGLRRRLDGRVRMEIQHRRSFPPLRDLRWSLEELR